MKQALTYKDAGVDYDPIDRFKREAQEEALRTPLDTLERFGFEEVAWSRGESAYLMRGPHGEYHAEVIEGLGTKAEIADKAAFFDIYAVNITGHGWRKLARRPEHFVYVIEDLAPEPHSVFPFMQKHGEVNTKEAYSTWNMGAGFAVYIDEDDVGRVIEIATRQHVHVWCGGFVESLRNQRKVVLKPLGIELDPPNIR